jgi:Fe-coproporphyrin III synthase
MNAALYGLKYVLSRRLLRRPTPLIRGLVLTNRCNLRCQHCRLHERPDHDLDFAEAAAAIDAFYDQGGRCLYLEGGEPFLWRDGDHDLDDVVGHAHRRGFLAVIIYTNGTRPVRTAADTVFVSVDGLQATHDALRGRSFDRIIAHIQESTHPSLYINYTINSRNKDDVAPFCAYVDALPRVRAIFFYFHTPYYGRDSLYIDLDDRRRVLEQLLDLRKTYRILNSRAGLLCAMRNDWARPMDACSVYEKGMVYSCCRTSDDPALCQECGYLSYAEIDQALKLKPSALLNALNYF